MDAFLAQYGDELFMLAIVFLIRHFFGSVTEKMNDLKSGLDKLDGRLTSVQNDVRENTTQQAVTKQEMAAVWRYIDNAPQRASDMNGRG